MPNQRNAEGKAKSNPRVARPTTIDRKADSAPTRRTAVSWLLYVALPPFVFFLTYGLTNWSLFSSAYAETSDYAVTGLQVWRASRFGEFLGPYSRFHFNHPGPIFFYIYALGERVFWFLQYPFGRYLLTQLILNFACVLAAMHSLYASGRARYEPALLFVCYLLALRNLPSFIHADVWGAAVIIAPALAFLISASAFARGRFELLPLVTIPATLLVQQHVSTTLVVLPIAIFALVAGCRAGFASESDRGRRYQVLKNRKIALLIGLCVPLIAFSLPLYEQLSSVDGNLSKLLRFFYGGNRASLQAEKEAARFVFGFYSRPLPGLGDLEPFLVFCAIVAFSAVLVWRQRDRVFMALFLFLGVILSVYAARRIVGEMMEYLLWVEYSFVSLFYFIFLLALISIFGSVGRVLRKWETAMPMLMMVAIPLLVIHVYRVPAPEFDPVPGELLTALKPDPERMYQIVINPGPHHDQWPLAAGLLLKMVREGCKVCVPDGWTFMFGESMRCPRGEGVIPVLFYSIPEAPAVDRARSFSIGNSRIDVGGLKLFQVPFTLRFDATDDRFTHFYAAENGFRWTEGKRASLLFQMTKATVPEQCKMIIKGFGNGRQSVTVTVNGSRIGETVVENHQPSAELLFPGRILKTGGSNEVVFDLPSARRPPNGDPRILALALIELVITTALPG